MLFHNITGEGSSVQYGTSIKKHNQLPQVTINGLTQRRKLYLATCLPPLSHVSVCNHSDLFRDLGNGNKSGLMKRGEHSGSRYNILYQHRKSPQHVQSGTPIATPVSQLQQDPKCPASDTQAKFINHLHVFSLLPVP